MAGEAKSSASKLGGEVEVIINSIGGQVRALIFGSLIVGLYTSALQASSSIRVVDGDTVEVSGVVYRLHGIDAPEAGQKCNSANGKAWACGQEAIAAMEALVLGKDVSCDNRGQDGYGRTIGVCKIGSTNLNAAMVQTGHAWAFRKYSEDYADLEEIAHQNHVGIWQAETEAPWDYRAHKWDVAKQAAPDGCPIKGNISGNGHIYHAPWSPWYGRTKVSIKQGERWFCTEKEAVEAGWRAPFWGR
ncbi:endonuclease YncB(thermonuclease family) [Ensifer adhaerens]|uniref:Endonuclease YncB(Thermonuclease family) n=1 Tax=Ensifer adhaerens TaxID=106592 RepID=A0ACC5SYY2_ENSAD|nr:thermonuclease family protein [Ensifer adhaerens]MBP1874038.1 endonuclease YncB(thermonuclease family) [Ensifer adhaerens]